MPRGPSARGFWSRRGIRARSTIVAVLAVAIALVIGGATLVVVLKVALTNSASQSVEQRARDVASEIADEDVEAATPTIDSAPGDSTLVQVLDSAGTVLVASPGISGEPAIVSGITPTSVPSTTTLRIPFVDDIEYAVAVMTANAHDGATVTVVAAQSLQSVTDTYGTVVPLLLIGAPFLLLAVGAITWFAVGTSLAGVDRIRSQVEVIGERHLNERVPVPVAKDEIERLAVTMNHMLERLESSSATQRQFVADASHELRSPLASMRASLDVTPPSEDWVSVHRVLSNEVDRMSRLVADLLLLAKADEGALQLRVSAVDLDDLATEEARRLRAQCPLTVSTALRPLQVTGDRARLAQALRNMVDNAARYARKELRISVTKENGSALIVVEDDGPGIPREARETVMMRFVRQDESRARDHGGTGLGLAITSEIARLHGGTVEISDSADLGGTQVSLVLPLGGSPTASSR